MRKHLYIFYNTFPFQRLKRLRVKCVYAEINELQVNAHFKVNYMQKSVRKL